MPRARSQLKAQERALIHWLALEQEPVEVHVEKTRWNLPPVLTVFLL